jgi:hypothetical protein
MRNVVSAVFTNREDAERAVDWLRDEGVPDDAISIAAPDSHMNTQRDYTGGGSGYATPERGEYTERGSDAADAGKGLATGAAVGATVGALFGLAASAIPGIGPFITAGALANALGTAGGAAAAGAIVGGTSGGLAGALSNWGVSSDDARYYAGEVERGGTWVGVDLSKTNLDATTITDAFARFNGNFSQRMAA